MRKALLACVIAIQWIGVEARGDTVVGLHGFLAGWKSMRQVKKALESSGFDVCIWEYHSREKYIQEHGCELAQALQEIAYQCPGRPIHFVTHSIGALILRSALNAPNCPMEAKIGRAVLIAPPNQGSCLARFFCDVFPISCVMGGRSGWELMHYGPNQVLCLGEFPPSMQVLVIAGTRGSRLLFKGPNDGYLALTETRLNTPFYFCCFPINHGDLLKNPISLCCTKNFLTGSGIPGPACADPGQ